MSVITNPGQLLLGEQKIPWQRIIFVLGVPPVLVGLLFVFLSASRAATRPLEQLPGQLPAVVLTDTFQAPNAADLGVSKTHSGIFTVGQLVTYTIIVSNTGTISITGPITVEDFLPASTAFMPTLMGGVNWGSCNFSDSPAVCVYSNTAGLDPGSALPPLRLRGTLGAGAAPVISNTVTIDHPEDTNSTNNSDTDVANVTGSPSQGADLAVTKLAVPTTPGEGETITYTVVLTNNGPSAASQIVLTDTLPASLTFITSTTTAGVYTSSRGTWNIDALPAGNNESLRLVARVNIGASGAITNTTEGVISDQPDGNTANNTGTAVINVRSTRLVGVVAVQNTGVAIPAATVRMTDSANHVYTATTGTTGHYTFTGTTSAPIQPGSATVTASSRGYSPQTATLTLVAGQDNQQNFSLAPAADLIAFKTNGRTTVSPGETITYTITITNAGFLPASGIVITDVLPTNVTYITDTLNLTHTTTSAGALVWRLPSNRQLTASGGSDSVLTFRLQARVSSTVANNTTLRNTVQASSTTVEGNPSDNTYTEVDTVSTTGAANLTVTKTVNPTSASPNGTLTFQIRIVNNSSAAVNNLTISDVFPSVLDITNATTTRGQAATNATTRTVTVTAGTLNPAEEVTVTITARVNSSATTTTTQSNTASLTFSFGGATQSRTSNTVSYQVIGSTTLPGTGWGPVSPPKVEARQPVSWLSVFFAIAGLAGLAAGLLAKALRRERVLFAGLGLWLLLMAFVMSPAAMSWLRPEGKAEIAQGPTHGSGPTGGLAPTPVEEESIQIIFPTPEVIETLPDYPVPTPQVTPTSGENGELPDTSEVQRILIPALGVDAVVKYVPFDGFTWMIAGLRQEVAWMGETSWPGLGGNTALAGHITLRDGNYGPFRYLEDLIAGDEITLFTEKKIYKYRVREQRVVDQADFSVVTQTQNKQLTLITCTGWNENAGFYLERLVVVADLLDEEPRRIETRGN